VFTRFDRDSDGVVTCDADAGTMTLAGVTMTGTASGNRLGICGIEASGNSLKFFFLFDDEGVLVCDGTAGTITLSGATVSGNVGASRGLCQAFASSATGVSFLGIRDDGDGVLLCDGNAGSLALTPVCVP
jgi:hypothetical protein